MRFGIGQPVTRKEDGRFLTGRGRYVADIDFVRQAHAVLVFSPHAHARIRAIDKAAAEQMAKLGASYKSVSEQLAEQMAKAYTPYKSAVENAADEIAVAAFLEGKLKFLGIAQVVESVLDKMPRTAMRSIDDVLAADSEARRLARVEVSRKTR